MRKGAPLTVALLALVCACGGWHPQTTITPSGSPAFDSTKTYRVTLKNGKRQVVSHPRVAGDSLTWVEPPQEGIPRMPPRRHTVPLSDIQRVELQGPNTVGVALVVILGFGFLKMVIQGGPYQ